MRWTTGFLLLLAFIDGTNAATQSHSPDKILGHWSSATLEGITPVGRSECTAIAVSQRRLRLSPASGTNKVEGEWVRWVSNMWMTTDNLRCRWRQDDTQFQPLFQATWLFLLDGTYDPVRGVVKIHGTYSRCDGNGCAVMLKPEYKKDFKTELRINNNGRLVDTYGTPDPSDDIQFIRVSDEADEVADAEAAFISATKLLDHGEFGRFYYESSSAEFRQGATRDQFISLLSAQRARTGTIVERQTIQKVYAEYAPRISKIPGQYVLFVSGVQGSKHLHGGEFLIFTKEAGRWKVYWINYGS